MGTPAAAAIPLEAGAIGAGAAAIPLKGRVTGGAAAATPPAIGMAFARAVFPAFRLANPLAVGSGAAFPLGTNWASVKYRLPLLPGRRLGS